MVARGIRIGPTIWTPASGLTGGAVVRAWWDADLGVSLSGANVLTWTDQAFGYVLGLNTIPVEVAPVSPTFSATSFGGKAGITFAGTTGINGQYLATVTTSVAMGSTTKPGYFVSATIGSGSNNYGRTLSHNNGTNADYEVDGFSISRDASTQAVKSSGPVVGVAITYDAPFRAKAIYDGTNVNFYVDGAAPQVVALTVTARPSVQVSVGNGRSAAGNLNGIMRRVLITSGDLDAGDITNIDTWLQG